MFAADSAVVRSPAATDGSQLVVTTQKLHELLKQREFHLAELIDEVVYAEERKEEAERGTSAVQRGVSDLEQAFQQLLRFHVVLSEEVVVPVLLDAVAQRMQRTTMLDAETRRSLQQLAASPSLSRATAQLIQRVLTTDAESRGAGLASGTPPSSGSSSNQVIEQAVVLSGMLCRKQRELQAPLEEVRHFLDQVLPPSYASDGRATSAEALMTINRGGRRSSLTQQLPAAAAEVAALQEQLSVVQRERDALLHRITSVDQNEAAVASLTADKRQQENELLYAQRRTLEEQNRTRELKARVAELEAALDRQQQANAQGLVSTEEELRRVSRSASITRASLEEENARLRRENAALVDSSERLMLNVPAQEAAANRKVAKLEGVIASLKADLHVMESRLAVVEDQRATERQRILSQFDRERVRLRKERDECQVLIDKMAAELRLLSLDNNKMRGAAAANEL